MVEWFRSPRRRLSILSDAPANVNASPAAVTQDTAMCRRWRRMNQKKEHRPCMRFRSYPFAMHSAYLSLAIAASQSGEKIICLFKYCYWLIKRLAPHQYHHLLSNPRYHISPGHPPSCKMCRRLTTCDDRRGIRRNGTELVRIVESTLFAVSSSLLHIW